MADKDGNKNGPVAQTFFSEPYRFEFQQAVRILERLHAAWRLLGDAFAPDQEIVQLKSNVYLSAPPSDIYTYEAQKGALWGRPVLTVNFLGIAGLQGPLPLPYTERIMERRAAKDFALDDFLQIFNHRLLSIFRRIYKKSSIGTADVGPEETQVGSAVQAFAGMGIASLRNRQRLPDRALMGFSGLLWHQPQSATMLTNMIKDFFNVPACVQPFSPAWKRMKASDQSRLGATLGQHQKLGKVACLGRRFWDELAGVHVVLGPLDLKAYEKFLPQGTGYAMLLDMMRYTLPPELDIDLSVRLKADQIPPSVLGKGAQLGYVGVLMSADGRSCSDLVVRHRIA